MKYIITFSIALALSMSGMAQTGLVFSQCLTFTGTANVDVNPNNQDMRSQDYIVPDGKIWKVEVISIAEGNSFSTHYLEINSLQVATLPYSLGPLWLKTGDVITLYFNGGGRNYIISILEFEAN